MKRSYFCPLQDPSCLSIRFSRFNTKIISHMRLETPEPRRSHHASLLDILHNHHRHHPNVRFLRSTQGPFPDTGTRSLSGMACTCSPMPTHPASTLSYPFCLSQMCQGLLYSESLPKHRAGCDDKVLRN